MKVKVKKTLKAGSNIWEEGVILDYPFPPEIQQEIDLQTGTVELIGGGQSKTVHGTARRVDHKSYEVRVRRIVKS